MTVMFRTNIPTKITKLDGTREEWSDFVVLFKRIGKMCRRNEKERYRYFSLSLDHCDT